MQDNNAHFRLVLVTDDVEKRLTVLKMVFIGKKTILLSKQAQKC
jgi:hypothetical protein